MNNKTVQNGKGSEWRNTDYKKYFSRHDEIDWKNTKNKNSKDKSN